MIMTVQYKDHVATATTSALQVVQGQHLLYYTFTKYEQGRALGCALVHPSPAFVNICLWWIGL